MLLKKTILNRKIPLSQPRLPPHPHYEYFPHPHFDYSPLTLTMNTSLTLTLTTPSPSLRLLPPHPHYEYIPHSHFPCQLHSHFLRRSRYEHLCFNIFLLFDIFYFRHFKFSTFVFSTFLVFDQSPVYQTFILKTKNKHFEYILKSKRNYSTTLVLSILKFMLPQAKLSFIGLLFISENYVLACSFRFLFMICMRCNHRKKVIVDNILSHLFFPLLF